MEKELSFTDETGWINVRVFEPDPGVDIIVKTPWGTRRAMKNLQSFGPAYIFTDTNHPMQNVNLSYYDIHGWRFARAEDASNLRLKQNHWQLQRDADEILSSMKYKVSFWQTFIQTLKKCIKNGSKDNR